MEHEEFISLHWLHPDNTKCIPLWGDNMATQAAISFWHFSPSSHAFLTAGAENWRAFQSSGSLRLTDNIENLSEASLHKFYTFQLTVKSFSAFSAGVKNTFCVHFAVFFFKLITILMNYHWSN